MVQGGERYGQIFLLALKRVGGAWARFNFDFYFNFRLLASRVPRAELPQHSQSKRILKY